MEVKKILKAKDLIFNTLNFQILKKYILKLFSRIYANIIILYHFYFRVVLFSKYFWELYNNCILYVSKDTVEIPEKMTAGRSMVLQ